MTYTANALNQYTQRTVPDHIWELGSAASNATVTINNQPVARRGEYFAREIGVANSASAVYTQLTTVAVLRNAGSNQLDIVSSVTGKVFVAKSPELFAYDADGNLTNDGRFAYVWDGENRLLLAESLTNTPTTSKRKVEWTYDHQSRRIRQKTYDCSSGSCLLTSDLLFVYDGWQCLAELNATNNAVVRSYVWGLDLSGTTTGAGGVGGLLMMNSVANGAHFYAYDGNGNVVALLSVASGEPAAVCEYSPFGETIRATGLMARENPFRFSTKRADDETGLVLYEYRPYQPATGRWLSRDPLGERAVWSRVTEEASQTGLEKYIRQHYEPPYLFVLNRPPELTDDNGLAYGNPVPPVVTLPPPPSYGRDWTSYGHYCGSGTRPPGYGGAPIDLVDAACMAHDNCYSRYRIPSWRADPKRTCGKRLCDTLLIDDLRAVRNSVMTSAEARRYANDAILLFSMLGGGKDPSQWEKCNCSEYRPVYRNP